MTVILFLKALKPGERWISVHPNGPDGKAQPILIQEQRDGSAKVVGGVGGKLNHLRLTGVKPKEEYKDAIRERAAARRESKKKQRERDKALGLKEAKAAAHKRLSDQQRAAGREFVEGVARAMGWDEADYKFDETKHEGLSEHVLENVQRTHEMEMLKRASEAVAMNRSRILADADARAEAQLGEVPLESATDEQISVQDLDPVKPSPAGLGYSPDYKGRSEKAGLTDEQLSAEAEAAKKPRTENQRKAAVRRGDTSKLVQENLEILRDGESTEKLRPHLVEAKKALELLKLEKRRKMVEAQVKKERKKINDATTEPKAYVIDIDNAKVDAGVADEVANDLRTIATRSFLAEVGKTADNPTATLGRHIGVGAYNSINALALAAGGAALVDRSVVDVLGIAGAAEVLSRRLHSDLTKDELETVAKGMEEFHLHHYMAGAEEAIAGARELQDQAAEIGGSVEAETGGDLAAMQEINRRRAAAIGEAQRVMGQALGEMEANAALVYALQRGRTDKPFQVSLGSVAVEDAIRQARAIGLQRGDYSLETVAGNRVLTVTAAGLDHLAKPVNRADLEQVRRNLDIITGKHDEANWLPRGISDRPDLDLNLKAGVAPSLAEAFAPGDDLEGSLKAYIGGRAADGDTPADIVADIQSAEFFQKAGAGRAEAYRAALDKLAPLRGADGNMRPAEVLQPAFEAMADEFVSARYGATRSPLHRQSFAVDEKSVDALHRALAAEPAGVAAYKPIGEMDHHDQRALREFFAQHVAHESPEAKSMRHELEGMETKEPERETTDMFGERATNPEWSEWRQRRDELAAKVNASSMNWPKYVESMHGLEKAYSAVQDLIRSRVAKEFVDTHNKLNPGKPLKLGRTVIRNNLDHLDAVDPKAREARAAKERALTDSLRERTQGRYAAGGVRDKLDAARQQEAGFDAAQMGFFAGDGDMAADPAPQDKPLASDERYTVGHEAERLIGSMMPRVGANFKAGQPVKLFRPTMSGGKNVARQRAVKMIEANKRVALSFGVGTGKTLIGLAGYTHLQQQGKVKRGAFLVPSIVQGQFGGEALRFLEPGKFKWHAEPGASREQRIAAYKDPSNHFVVMTHQSFRDDMLHLGAQHAGATPEEMAAKVDAMTRPERKAWMKGVMEREGIDFDYLNVDEGHNTLNRKGKENSSMANVIDSLSDNTPYYVSASGDPIKNDVSEAFSLLQKMDPERYTDEAAFTRKYGVDTVSAKDELRREMARFQYPSKIDPDVVAKKTERSVPVSAGQKRALATLDDHFAKARLARMRGGADVAAMKAISPSSFEGVPADKHEVVARELTKNLGILKSTAIRRVLDTHPSGAKVDDLAKVVSERTGKPGVVFAHSLDAVEAIRARLEKEGHRVVTITGKDSAKDKEAKRRAFNPDVGDASADILVASDAGATGMNVQRGQWLYQYDTPMTAMTHAQRQGRINRTGQKNDIELIDAISDHPEERRARERLKTKYGLRDIMTSPMESLDDTGVAFFLKQKASEVTGVH